MMLGWEFPPHISGGLGTACHGLARGVRDADVDVLFVVPRRFGGEDPLVPLVAAGEALERGVPPRLDVLAELEQVAGVPVVVDDVARMAVVATDDGDAQVAVDSALAPYLDPDGYLAAIGRPDLPDEAFGPASVAPDAPVARHPDPPSTRPGPAAQAAAPPTQRPPHAFEGGYGKNLFAEVARYAEAVAVLAASEAFDVIHAHDWMTVTAGVAAREVSGKPLVVHAHALEYDRSGDDVDTRIRDLERLGFEAADRIVAVSHFTKRRIVERYGIDAAKIRVVHNAVVHQERDDGDGQSRAIEEPIVLFLGRVTFQKGPDYFLQAARKVVDVEPNVKFVVAGSGDLLPRTIERAAELDLAEHVHFTGFLRGAEVERMFRMADLYVMPSVAEPFGIAPLEAMALDVPVIVSKQSGVSEVLTHALKVDFWDVDETAAQILSVIRDPELRARLVEGGRAELGAMQWSARGRSLKAVYEELVA